MPIVSATAVEKHLGRSGETRSDNNREQRVWFVFNATDEADAVGTAYTAAPATILAEDGSTLYRGAAEWNPVAVAADASSGTYEVTISYSPQTRTRSEVGTIRFTYDTTGATAHITQAINEIEVYRADTSAAAPDFQGVIGLNGEDVEGTDVPVPIFNMTVTIVLAPADLPNVNDVLELTGKTNNSDFTVTDSVTGETISFLPKEMIFLGGRHGDPRADGNVEMSYVFTASPNVTNQTIGSITGIDKDGSQYAWAYLAADTDGSGPNKTLILTPKFVIIDEVVPEGDYSVLGSFT